MKVDLEGCEPRVVRMWESVHGLFGKESDVIDIHVKLRSLSRKVPALIRICNEYRERLDDVIKGGHYQLSGVNIDRLSLSNQVSQITVTPQLDSML